MKQKHGGYAFLSVLAAAFILSLALPGADAQYAASALVILLVAVKDAAALTKLGGLKFWLFPLAFALLSPLVAGEPGMTVMGRAYSKAQLDINALFLLHAYCFVIAGAYYGRNYTLSDTVELGRRLGLKTLGLRAAMAVCAAKKLELMIAETARTYARTRPSKADKLRGFPVLAGAVIRNTVIIAEELSVLLYIRKIEL